MKSLSKRPLFCLLICLGLGGCASTSNNPKDPFESFNRGSYKFNDALDKAVLKPVAKGYNTVMPTPARRGLSNFFSNLNDVTVTVNDLLQFKVKQAASDTGRMVVNTTVGLLGLIDVATPMGLDKHNEDFGQTLGYWGLGSGPYLMLPFLGPSSVRDSAGLYADTMTSQTNRIKHVAVRNEIYLTSFVVKRAALLDEEKVLDEAAIDRYSFIRDAYLQHRQNLVYDGNPPREKYDDDDDDSKPDVKSGKSSSAGGVEVKRPQAIEAVPVASPVNPETQPDSPAAATPTSATPVPQ